MPDVATQLAEALASADVSQNELARRLVAAEGGDVSDPKLVAARRRHISKILHPERKGGVPYPTPKTMTRFARALGLEANHFKIPDRPAPEERESPIAEILRRLEAVEAVLPLVWANRDKIDAVLIELAQAGTRIAALEALSQRGSDGRGTASEPTAAEPTA